MKCLLLPLREYAHIFLALLVVLLRMMHTSCNNLLYTFPVLSDRKTGRSKGHDFADHTLYNVQLLVRFCTSSFLYCVAHGYGLVQLE